MATLVNYTSKGFIKLTPGLKTGVKNDIFWSEIGSGFGESGGTPPHQEFLGVTPPPGWSHQNLEKEAIPVVQNRANFRRLSHPYTQ